MCGIAGVFNYGASAAKVDAGELLRIRESMRARGPDGEGIWISRDERIGLAHRRLAIIDVSIGGAQPMSTPDGRLHITFNGEIYNYGELRRELEAAAVQFRSSSDTEVLLHLYAAHGAEMVHKLRGMYAFAIFDDRDETLFLARDPFGIKPLYYTDRAGTFRFASQVKALLRSGQIDTGPSAAGIVGFFLWGHVPEPHTLYRDITALPAGSAMTISKAKGAGTPKPFFRIADEYANASGRASDADPRQILRAAITDSVAAHLVADVPVGLFLSAGLDSATLCAVASAQIPLRTVTLGFEEYRGTQNDETMLAQELARMYGTRHETRWISHREFDAALDHVLDAMDQPSIDGVNTYFVSRAAAEAGMKVALSGLGGDELLGGYPSFRQIPRVVHATRRVADVPALGKGFRMISERLLGRLTSPKYAGVLEYGSTYGGAYLLRRGLFMPWELPRMLDPDLVREGWRVLQPIARLDESVSNIDSAFHKVSALELQWYMRNQLLRDSDWAGMAHSLEIRVPLVDATLFRSVAPLTAAGGVTKVDMALAPERPVPTAFLRRKKTGFSIPVRTWALRHTRGRERGLRAWSQHVIAHAGISI